MPSHPRPCLKTKPKYGVREADVTKMGESTVYSLTPQISMASYSLDRLECAHRGVYVLGLGG